MLVSVTKIVARERSFENDSLACYADDSCAGTNLSTRLLLPLRMLAAAYLRWSPSSGPLFNHVPTPLGSPVAFLCFLLKEIRLLEMRSLLAAAFDISFQNNIENWNIVRCLEMWFAVQINVDVSTAGLKELWETNKWTNPLKGPATSRKDEVNILLLYTLIFSVCDYFSLLDNV